MILLMTDWKHFLTIDVQKLYYAMNGKVVVDTKNFLDRVTYKKVGFTYVGIGIQ